ncbi:hypothetical protein LSH36_661g01025 [Paralvinella palmiformis]|uniref:Uncharacterized protein n=1 Tax=Paralvinella palmiformis TaxID=53620 RepID=A0AAD9MUB5_9ANNE|nr:hypothetical protein LSH36_661g01025 [Paralvinella palmiformis]
MSGFQSLRRIYSFIRACGMFQASPEALLVVRCPIGRPTAQRTERRAVNVQIPDQVRATAVFEMLHDVVALGHVYRKWSAPILNKVIIYSSSLRNCLIQLYNIVTFMLLMVFE